MAGYKAHNMAGYLRLMTWQAGAAIARGGTGARLRPPVFSSASISSRVSSGFRYAPLLHRNVQRFRGGLVFKAHRLCVSLNSRLDSNEEEEDAPLPWRCRAKKEQREGFQRCLY